MAKIDIDRLEREIKEIRKSKKISNTTLIGIIIIVGIVALILIIGMIIGNLEAPRPIGMPIECTSDSCFIEAADDCELAVYNTRIETLSLRLKSTDDCKLIKKVTGVDETEPEKIQELFKGTEMTCPYRIGEFDKKYIEQISYDMLTCTGSLVEAIKKIL